MRVAIVGCGTMGTVHTRNLARMPDVQAAGVCDQDAERAAAAAAIAGTAAYTELDELLDKERPEAVIVCLPTYLHKETVIRIAERGIHVICEKPAASTLEDARDMEAACRKHGVRLFIGHVVRFFPNYRNAAEHVKAGAIGKVRMGHFKRHGSFPRGWDLWYHDRERSGGVIMDLMIHDIDFARSVFGEVESVYARITPPSVSKLEYAQVTLKFAGGAAANLTAFWGYNGPFTTQFEIAGDDGIIRFDSNQVQSFDLKTSAETGEQAAVQVPQSPMLRDPYYDEVQHFIQCIRTGTEPLVTIDDACKAVEIALAAERSAKLGQPVALEVAPR
ncbi:dehydrogenase [Paenibacillus cisolokensis]|uniref:Dehydrogenase n=1 Tax=Paenibacillus cisolokensis TaxID=1658519 RepID=A0ABQ4N3I0_9BACL|nr:Gfo/Idh/MocA family oxidoreductase [Paenibacillus cisolokensis]GIQ62722.1 dehydrogenase [Paenibacillus cisolokensis]